MSELTAGQRDALPSHDFALPKERRYPIHDIEHARNALARVAQHGSLEEIEQVHHAVYTRYPALDPKQHGHHGGGGNPDNLGGAQTKHRDITRTPHDDTLADLEG